MILISNLIILGLLWLAWLLWRSASKQTTDIKSLQRFNHLIATSGRRNREIPLQSEKPVFSVLAKDQRSVKLIGLSAFLALTVLIQIGWGWVPTIMVCSLVWLSFHLYPRLKRAHMDRRMVAQLPLFIDQLIRSLNTGRSLESAFRLVAVDTNYPLRNVLDKVIKATDHGASFGHAFESEMRQIKIKEFESISLGIRISNTYGSSPKEMLQSVINLIRNREQARNELAAMTGETKISAWILTLTPTAIVIYMFAMNPGYLEMMLSDATGALIFKIAIALQVVGALLFWKMLKSV